MSKIVWDRVGEHFYETGVNKGVLYSFDKTNRTFTNGVAWNGLSAVNESPSGAEPTAIFADNIKYLNLMSAEQYAATIEAYTYPPEFDKCNGLAEVADGVTIGQQNREMFGFAYQTLLGSDTEGTARGYRIHLVYNCSASPSEKNHATVNDNPEAASMSWSISTTPVEVTGYKPTATIEIDSTKFTTAAGKAKLAALEAILYGTPSSDPRMPLPDEIVALIGQADTAATLSALAIDGVTLSPTFSSAVKNYTAETTDTSNEVSATAESGASAVIKLNGNVLTSGSAATWNEGSNVVSVTVTKEETETGIYTVVVTKS